MNLIKYPTDSEVNQYLGSSEPLLLLVSFDGETVIVSHIDEAVEHSILLAKAADRAGYRPQDIDKFFRVVVDNTGADWTFVCPADYQGMTDKEKRLAAFYKDGFRYISAALSTLGYLVEIKIPKRYRRHFNMLSE